MTMTHSTLTNEHLKIAQWFLDKLLDEFSPPDEAANREKFMIIAMDDDFLRSISRETSELRFVILGNMVNIKNTSSKYPISSITLRFNRNIEGYKKNGEIRFTLPHDHPILVDFRLALQMTTM